MCLLSVRTRRRMTSVVVDAASDHAVRTVVTETAGCGHIADRCGAGSANVSGPMHYGTHGYGTRRYHRGYRHRGGGTA